MDNVKYIENETQLPVLVSSSYGWPPLGVIMCVTYATGHRYAVRQEEFEKHFTVVQPQEIFVSGNNMFDGRPTAQQLGLQKGDAPCPEV